MINLAGAFHYVLQFFQYVFSELKGKFLFPRPYLLHWCIPTSCLTMHKTLLLVGFRLPCDSIIRDSRNAARAIKIFGPTAYL